MQTKKRKGNFSVQRQEQWLNRCNWLDKPCLCVMPEETMNVPKIEAVDFGSKCRLAVCFLRLIWFWFYVYLSLVFSDCFHWWVCLLVLLLSSFFFPFVSVYICFFVWFCTFSFAFTICFVLLPVHFFFLLLSFLPCRVAGRVLVLWPGVGPEPLRWESWVQDIGPPETSSPM